MNNILIDKINRKYLTLATLALSLFHLVANGQTETKPERLKDYLKKEKGKYGVWSTHNKNWEIAPEYDKITGVAFTPKEYDQENHVCYKFWKEGTFDLVRRAESKKDRYLMTHTIVIKDINDFTLPFITVDCNYIYYKKNGRWGWAAAEITKLESGFYNSHENIVVDPVSDNPPVLLKAYKPESSSLHEDPVLIIDSAGLKGLYTFSGTRLVSPGPFKNFKEGSYFYITEGNNGLLGYSINGKNVEPLYKDFATKTYGSDKMKKEYVVCYLPDGSFDLRDGTKLLSTAERAELEKIENRKKEEADLINKGLVQLTTSLFSINVYSNWKPYCTVNGNSITIGLNNNTQSVLGNGPLSWVNKEKKKLYGNFSINCETLETTFETLKSDLVDYYARAKATRWDSNKSSYTNPSTVEISKAKTSITPIIEEVTTQSGQKGKTVFYIAEVPGLGNKLNYKLVVPDLSDNKKIKIYTIEFGGESDPSVIMESKDFKAWQDYFKTVLLSVK